MKPYGYQPGKSYPLVLSIHGGPHSNYGNVLFPEFQMLAGQGYWTLFTNPRGSSGYGHASPTRPADAGGWRTIRSPAGGRRRDRTHQSGVDTTRMASWRVLRRIHDELDRRPHEPFGWRKPIARSSTGIRGTGSSDAQGLTDYEFNGAPWERDSLYRVMSPMTYAKNMRTPMLIVHSEDDKRTPITTASSSSCRSANAGFRRSSCAIRVLPRAVAHRSALAARRPAGADSATWFRALDRDRRSGARGDRRASIDAASGHLHRASSRAAGGAGGRTTAPCAPPFAAPAAPRRHIAAAVIPRRAPCSLRAGGRSQARRVAGVGALFRGAREGE